MPQRSLHERRVVITGASSGVGRALALQLAPYGTHLLLVARSEQPLSELAHELVQRGAASAEVVVGDVTDPDVRSQIIQRVADQWQRLDLLVNNAGVSAHGRFAESDQATLRTIMEVNLFSAVELTRQALPLLRAGQDPLVVNVGSILGHLGVPHNSEYCASKFALRGWSQSLRAELGRDGIDVLLVSPGSIETGFFDHLIASKEQPRWPQQKGISPAAVARQITRAIVKRRHEIYPNWRGRLLVTLTRCCPGLVDRVLKWYG